MSTRFFHFISDLLVMVGRNLTHYQRIPQLIIFSTIQPVMFILLFNYVFGGAIRTGGSSAYINYLLPGILAQTAIFGSMATGMGLAVDVTKGIVDRFKSLPMARSAFLLGRTFADMMRNIFVIALMFAVGYLVGFRLQGTFSDLLTSSALLLLFGFAFSWISAAIGLWVRSIETAQVAGFIWVFPLVFASSAFVPVQTMPDWLQHFAKWNPVTLTVNAARALLLDNASDLATATYVWQSLCWIAVILAIFIPLSVYLYRRAA